MILSILSPFQFDVERSDLLVIPDAEMLFTCCAEPDFRDTETRDEDADKG